MLCTLQPDLIPSKYGSTVGKIFEPAQDEDLLPIWDVTEGKWKSFRISKVNLFRTADELKKSDKSGQDMDSKQKVMLDKRNQKIKEQSQKRKEKINQQIEESKQSAKERVQKAKDIVNRLRQEAIERRNNE